MYLMTTNQKIKDLLVFSSFYGNRYDSLNKANKLSNKKNDLYFQVNVSIV